MEALTNISAIRRLTQTIGSSTTQGLGKVPLHQNQYGANLGGPVLKNKLFFFFSWEHESLSSATPASYVMPTTAELNGDFSGDPQVIYDPNTGIAVSGNSIAGRIDPAALKILQLETPNESMSQAALRTSTIHLCRTPAVGVQTQYNARIDATLGKDTSSRATRSGTRTISRSILSATRRARALPATTRRKGCWETITCFLPPRSRKCDFSYLENYNFQDPLSNGFDMSSIDAVNWGAIPGASGLGKFSLPALAIQGYSVGPNLSAIALEQ
jgi:hypothetical protein